MFTKRNFEYLSDNIRKVELIRNSRNKDELGNPLNSDTIYWNEIVDEKLLRQQLSEFEDDINLLAQNLSLANKHIQAIGLDELVQLIEDSISDNKYDNKGRFIEGVYGFNKRVQKIYHANGNPKEKLVFVEDVLQDHYFYNEKGDLIKFETKRKPVTSVFEEDEEKWNDFSKFEFDIENTYEQNELTSIEVYWQGKFIASAYRYFLVQP